MTIHRIPLIAALAVAVLATGCERYLSVKPDKKMAEPLTLADCAALLDNTNEMNTRFPAAGEAASDNHFLSHTNWNALTSLEDRLNYLWDGDNTPVLTQWQYPYKVVTVANQALHTLRGIDRSVDPAEYDRILGTALFFRAYAHYSVAQEFAPAYNPATAATVPGIPIRLTPDIAASNTRATLEQTYAQIESDLREAASLLPEQVVVKTRPSKAAAYAALARTLLAMARYDKAAEAAGQALVLQGELMDYNMLNPTASIAFQRFNTEVIFHATASGNTALNPTRARVDTILYTQYEAHDLRKQLFFVTHADGYHRFKGKYDGANNASPFAGLAVDEVYLIRAEALARTNRVPDAMAVLNQLLATRWAADHFTPFAAQNEMEALTIILAERRKQLLCRNLRWGDLKRLNTDPRFANTLVRLLNGQRYELPPNDPRYSLLIPRQVIDAGYITQNPR